MSQMFLTLSGIFLPQFSAIKNDNCTRLRRVQDFRFWVRDRDLWRTWNIRGDSVVQ